MTGAFSTFMARYANCSDMIDSSEFSLAGPIVAINAVFELPPSESLSILVSLESLKGTCCYLESVRA